ncbi:MAG: type IV pilus assembly protein PilM [Calditrichaeota bacterium]|nr:MAG: type IV pilus assembly protein PilM [Calditrichota bacterium]
MKSKKLDLDFLFEIKRKLQHLDESSDLPLFDAEALSDADKPPDRGEQLDLALLLDDLRRPKTRPTQEQSDDPGPDDEAVDLSPDSQDESEIEFDINDIPPEIAGDNPELQNELKLLLESDSPTETGSPEEGPALGFDQPDEASLRLTEGFDSAESDVLLPEPPTGDSLEFPSDRGEAISEEHTPDDDPLSAHSVGEEAGSDFSHATEIASGIGDFDHRSESVKSPAPQPERDKKTAASNPFEEFAREYVQKKAGRGAGGKSSTPETDRKAKQEPATRIRQRLTQSISLGSLLENVSLLGLDLGSHALKYVHLKKTARGLKLLNCGSFPMPEMSVDDEDAQRKEKIATAIREHLQRRNFRNTAITSAVSGLEVVYKNIQLPGTARKELAKAVPWACRKDFPFPLDATVFEYLVTDGRSGQKQDKLDVFVVAAQKKLVSNHVEILRKASFVPSKVSTVPVALWNLLRATLKKDANKCYGIIDIGAHSSHLVFVNRGMLQFAREISTGGADFTEALTGVVFVDGNEITLDKKQAEQVKRRYGIPAADDGESRTEEGVPLQDIAGMLGPVLERLVGEIQRTVEFYKERFKIERLEKVFVTGGGALMPNLISALQEQLHLPFEVLNPFETISLKKFKDWANLLRLGPRFAVAAGLALDVRKELNLLPGPLKGSLRYRYLSKIYRYVAMILLLGMTLLSQSAARQFHKLQARFKRIQAEYKEAEPKRKQFLKLSRELQRLQKTKKALEETLDLDLSAANHLRAVSRVFPPNMALTSFKIVYRNRKVEGSDTYEVRQVVILEGVAFENNSMEGVNLAEFLLALERLDYFESVSLKSQQIRKDGHLQFTIECET